MHILSEITSQQPQLIEIVINMLADICHYDKVVCV